MISVNVSDQFLNLSEYDIEHISSHFLYLMISIGHSIASLDKIKAL